MRLALYQPDIPQNAGALFRLAACLDIPLDIIEPCGFPLDDRKIRRSAMDYVENMDMTRHVSWAEYQQNRTGRLVLLTTSGDVPLTGFSFTANDTIMVGRESAGVPDEVHEAADARVRIPMAAGMRSLNVALSAAMALGEAMRQTDLYPKE